MGSFAASRANPFSPLRMLIARSAVSTMVLLALRTSTAASGESPRAASCKLLAVPWIIASGLLISCASPPANVAKSYNTFFLSNCSRDKRSTRDRSEMMRCSPAAASSSSERQGRDLPRCTSSQAAKDFRGLKRTAPSFVISLEFSGFPAQWTVSATSPRIHRVPSPGLLEALAGRHSLREQGKQILGKGQHSRRYARSCRQM